MDYECRDISIEGLVQGVGFRPFLRKLADRYQISGWSKNTSWGVSVKAGGSCSNLDLFLKQLHGYPPKNSTIESMTVTPAETAAFSGFQIHQSLKSEQATRLPADVVTCESCLSELLNPSDRRYQYPFISCAECGPRFTILNELPFDRSATTMDNFPLCEVCSVEYGDPQNRRFHAQTNSCADCGPKLRLTDQYNRALCSDKQIISKATELLAEGSILGLKGIGGYQLVCLAAQDAAVLNLRQHKRRKEKPLAVMVKDIRVAHRLCQLNDKEVKALEGKEGPIVIASLRQYSDLSANITCGLDELGIMLPSSPLHHLLMQSVDAPLVVTSGNRAGEPIIIDDDLALQKLGAFCEGFLSHNRTISHKADDPVVRIISNSPTLFRTGRGYAPSYFPNHLSGVSHHSDALATGSHSKNTFSLLSKKNLTLSQHMGTLDSPEAFEQFETELQFYKKIHQIREESVVCDKHPDYGSTTLAEHWPVKKYTIQHHAAHVMACAFEHGFQGRAYCVAWDGMGLGDDNTSWGGEFFALDTDKKTLDRVASLRPFKLPGGDKAAMEPRRSAMALMFDVFGSDATQPLSDFQDMLWARSFSAQEWAVLTAQITSKRDDLTSSMGRLFDGVASILGLKQINTFEGQAAMLLESVADKSLSFDPLPFDIKVDGRLRIIDWYPAIRELVRKKNAGTSATILAARFHHTLTAVIVKLCDSRTEDTVLLSGGVFQNKFLTETTLSHLKDRGIRALRSAKVPPNDGGLSVGQIAYQLYEIGPSACA